jgi:hypothetical protein
VTSPRIEGPWQSTTLRVLEPGMDYMDDVMYMTIPQFRTVQKRVGKSDPPVYSPTIEKNAACISTDHQFFLYDAVNLYERRLAFPDTFVVNERGWGGPAAQRWTDGEATAPEPWDIYKRIRTVYENHVEFSDEMTYDFMTLWLLATYFFRLFDTFGYVHFGGTKESGKTQNLRILQVLSFNASLSAHMTAADLFRNIAGNPGTICIDEAENFRSERGEALLEILRSGYKKGIVVSRQRQMPDGRFVPDKFHVYGPKALASINPLDTVTSTRTFKVQMRPALRAIPEFKADAAPHAALIDDLHYFALANAPHVDTVLQRWTAGYRADRAPLIINRQWELAVPVIVMADYIGGDTLTDPLLAWLTTYFETERKRDDSMDNIRALVISLPTTMRNNAAVEGRWYNAKDILATYKDFTDEDASEKVTTRTIVKYLAPLGLSETRANKGGKQVAITEEMLRSIYRERRIDPRDEDRAWLEGTADYQWTSTVTEQPQTERISWNDDS